jgi:cystathionine beta-lyase/cystathionine gamma-synthase
MRPETLAVHAGAEPDAATGAVAPPIHLSTTFAHGPAAERIAGYEYQREGNPTQDRLETALAALEGGATALAFASGMAAITALLEALPNGARILIPDDCYTGLRLLAQDFLARRGIVAVAVDMSDLAAVRTASAGNVALVWAETPSNPRMKVADIAALAQIAHAHGALLVCDNTFAAPMSSCTRPRNISAATATCSEVPSCLRGVMRCTNASRITATSPARSRRRSAPGCCCVVAARCRRAWPGIAATRALSRNSSPRIRAWSA